MGLRANISSCRRKGRARLRTCEGGVHEESLMQISDSLLNGWVDRAHVAHKHLDRDVDYVVYEGKVQIVDLDTGRIHHHSRWSGGLREMVEVKEGVRVQPESGTVASISHPSYFEPYTTIYGITGTVGEQAEREEVLRVYELAMGNPIFFPPTTQKNITDNSKISTAKSKATSTHHKKTSQTIQ